MKKHKAGHVKPPNASGVIATLGDLAAAITAGRVPLSALRDPETGLSLSVHHLDGGEKGGMIVIFHNRSHTSSFAGESEWCFVDGTFATVPVLKGAEQLVTIMCDKDTVVSYI